MNDARKREISTIIAEIAKAETSLRQRGMEVTDPDDWQQLRDIVARIERRLLANMPAAAE